MLYQAHMCAYDALESYIDSSTRGLPVLCVTLHMNAPSNLNVLSQRRRHIKPTHSTKSSQQLDDLLLNHVLLSHCLPTSLSTSQLHCSNPLIGQLERAALPYAPNAECFVVSIRRNSESIPIRSDEAELISNRWCHTE